MKERRDPMTYFLQYRGLPSPIRLDHTGIPHNVAVWFRLKMNSSSRDLIFQNMTNLLGWNLSN